MVFVRIIFSWINIRVIHGYLRRTLDEKLSFKLCQG